MERLRIKSATPETLKVPIELINEFILNPLNSLRDYGSIPTDSIYPFFTDVSKLDLCLDFENPFDSVMRVFDDDFQCNDDFFRYMHIDLGWKKDGLGISMCHIPKWINVRRAIENKEQQRFEEIEVLQPYIVFDFTGRITTENRSEILISYAQELVLELSYKRNFFINLITFDRFESVQTIQSLRDLSFNVAHLSIDRTAYKAVVDYDKEDRINRVTTDKQYNAAFEGFRYAIMEERVRVNYHPDWEQETRGLEYIVDKDKVIKSPHSSDDLIQSIVGSAFNAANNEQPEIPMDDSNDVKTDDSMYEKSQYSGYGNTYEFNKEMQPEFRHPNHSVGII